ncbi:L-aspartate oxidase [Acetobacter oeni]|uniref:L-aspartate oxidase n=2 Tax=Acetobacter oeni TaxID=304077 RepID=A0A511XJ05_9PROT|nr:L-aspartate oxidase [Acetobacter oeni]MBB3882664.1 L-aspartate oxidase [Acetobacter oeni]NHO18766.1 L-aspartate oxidase [Acetobacter oeni]GEN62919.1 L-aspartate oxidase [Acetobacter oeni]
MDILSRYTDLPVIAGAGLAGLSTALHLDRPCVLLSAGLPGDNAASSLAQGGLAAAVGPDDSPGLHAADTMAAGAGLCDPVIVNRITAAGPRTVETLLEWGVPFARTSDNALSLHLEAAHSRPRIVYANGDASGAAIMKTLIARVRNTSRITVLENTELTGLHMENGAIGGVSTSQGFISTRACIIASGGIGALYTGATSPMGCSGSALAIAARAGVELIDMEFTQFHPTALDAGAYPGRRPLISEAVRGAGARLVDETGKNFTDELAPRDVVARAIAAHQQEGHKVFLDARSLSAGPFSQLFPGITAACFAVGINPEEQPVPVRPAMHYHMGGIATDGRGRSSLPGLWAAGEAGCNGLHGANRLASNSLLEAFVSGEWVARDLKGIRTGAGKMACPASVARLSASFTVGNMLMQHAGILRNAAGLKQLLQTLSPHTDCDQNALIAALVAQAALNRHQSRGSHYRADDVSAARPPMHKSKESFGDGALRQTITVRDLTFAKVPEQCL